MELRSGCAFVAFLQMFWLACGFGSGGVCRGFDVRFDVRIDVRLDVPFNVPFDVPFDVRRK